MARGPHRRAREARATAQRSRSVSDRQAEYKYLLRWRTPPQRGGSANNPLVSHKWLYGGRVAGAEALQHRRQTEQKQRARRSTARRQSKRRRRLAARRDNRAALRSASAGSAARQRAAAPQKQSESADAGSEADAAPITAQDPTPSSQRGRRPATGKRGERAATARAEGGRAWMCYPALSAVRPVPPPAAFSTVSPSAVVPALLRAFPAKFRIAP